jgi:hypothetical protein
MTTLRMELPPDVYRRLLKEARHLGKSPQDVAQEWVVERLMTRSGSGNDGRQKVREALQEAGLLSELSPNLRRLADPAVRLEDVKAALERAEGKALSEIILDQRGPKE